LIDDIGNARLCDFGLSLFLGGQVGSGFTTTTKHVGTIRYAAPEIFSPDAVGYKPTPASDIFSLGCVIYEVKLDDRFGLV
jgi:eukaryotic-like serine/threonine-protein kinase